MDYTLLKELCAVQATSGNEDAMTQYLLNYIEKKKNSWKTVPLIFSGGDFGECIILIFGQPRTAIFAHIDSIGFTVRYNNQLVRIGAPVTENGIELIGSDKNGPVSGKMHVDDRTLQIISERNIERGTDLTFKPNWIEDGNFVQCCYMDNRLGVWTALKVAETLTDGVIVFSCREEHGGGSVPFLTKFLFEKYAIRQSLILDITWVTEGVKAGNGVAISMRDVGIPRRKFLSKIIQIAEQSGIPFQLEVEGSGGSDGTEIQKQIYPIDWCFIGAPEDNVHSPQEKVHKKDIESMLAMYNHLMEKL